jgi:hypothetical protein
MFDCDKCKNETICKNRENTQEFKNGIARLITRHKDGFYGRIETFCDYYVPNIQERSCSDSYTLKK